VFIETPRSLNFTDQDRRDLAESLQLASQLGGNVSSIAAANVIEGLKAFLDEVRATQLVIGKSARSRWFELRHGSVVDQLVRQTPGVAVHVLPNEEMTERAAAQAKPPRRRGAWGKPLDYVISALAVAVCTAFAVAVHSFVGLANVALLYLIPVLASASRYGLRTALFTGLVSALAYNFFFMEPRYTFTIADPENVLTVVVFIVVAVVTSQLASRVRVQAQLAEQSSGQNAALASFAGTLARLTSRQELGQTLCGEVSLQFAVDTVMLLPSDAATLEIVSAVPPDAALGPIDMAAAEWAMDHKEPAGRSSGTLAASEWLFQPLLSGGHALGVLGVARSDGGDPIRSDRLPFLMSFIDQAALALDRVELERTMRAASRKKNPQAGAG
jgi:two-component system sensor histidine kinase KdpD